MWRQAEISVALTGLLLAGMAVQRTMRPGAADAEPYHAEVKRLVDAIPLEFGNWVGTDREVPPSAIKMLKPNGLLSREYRNVSSGVVAQLLLVQCKDARDLAGHYPPVCYPAHGWVLKEKRERQWELADWRIVGTEYAFMDPRPAGGREMVVENFLLLPGGIILQDMDGVRRAASDYTKHFYGAAQVQVLFPADVPDAVRTEAFEEIVRAARGAIDAVLRDPAASGGKEL